MTERIDCNSVKLTESVTIFIVVVLKLVVMMIGIFGLILQVKLDRVQPNDDEPRSAFVAGHIVALLGLGIYEDFLGTFGADRCRHLCQYS